MPDRARVTWACTCTILLIASIAHAGVLHDIAADVAVRLAALHPAPTKPAVPVPIAVKWRPQKLTPSVELGAPLLALTAGDLDGDGKPELYAVTTREVIAFGLADHHVKELARVAFAGEPAMPVPRDPVGAVVVEGKAVIASSSAFARGIAVTWRGKQLVATVGEPGVELCAGERVALVAGRNYFGDDRAGFYGVRCKDVLDAAGQPQRVRAVLGLTGKLEIAAAATFVIAKAGTAFDIGDLDRDGKPEVAYASANAPGEPDEVRVVTLGEDERKTKLKKAFNAGGVAGLAMIDVDGAPAVIAAVRLVGATRIDLWRLN